MENNKCEPYQLEYYFPSTPIHNNKANHSRKKNQHHSKSNSIRHNTTNNIPWRITLQTPLPDQLLQDTIDTSQESHFPTQNKTVNSCNTTLHFSCSFASNISFWYRKNCYLIQSLKLRSTIKSHVTLSSLPKIYNSIDQFDSIKN